MPFQRVQLNGIKVPDRTITGALPPPEPGVSQSEDGIIVGSVADPAGIKAGTEVVVTLPGPKEILFDSRGIMTPRWYRFFSELHRRTGGTRDNVNFVPALRKLPLEPFALMITGPAPTAQIVHIRMMGVGSLAITGIAPTVAVA
jgi:hypothetical protein